MKRTLILIHILLLASLSSVARVGASDAAVQFNRGIAYFYGQGVKQDRRKGCDYFERAAKLGLGNAQYNLGNCYRTGHGRRRNLTMAAAWYEKAARANVALAKNSLAMIYLFDAPDPAKGDKAIALLREAVSAGDRMAPLTLGFAYHKGVGVKHDDKKALANYAIAGARGNILADALLYKINQEGMYGLKPDPQNAQYWLHQFHTNRASYYDPAWTVGCALSSAYRRGWGLPQDDGKAKTYEKDCRW